MLWTSESAVFDGAKAIRGGAAPAAHGEVQRNREQAVVHRRGGTGAPAEDSDDEPLGDGHDLRASVDAGDVDDARAPATAPARPSS